ncbi:hypothetical protein B0O80DRAFT_460104 [Mortierella sp. GBAus27b]|nr:hypothetical protein B0O80DRAFT_460104 [Mortierella sp. GBAus27b]
MKALCAILHLVIATLVSTTVAAVAVTAAPTVPVSETETTKVKPNPVTVSGWPSSITIEIDKLELGGLSLPMVQSLVENSVTEAKNFGNIATTVADQQPVEDVTKTHSQRQDNPSPAPLLQPSPWPLPLHPEPISGKAEQHHRQHRQKLPGQQLHRHQVVQHGSELLKGTQMNA